VWNFKKEDIEAFVRSYPYVLDIKKIQHGCYRDIVAEEFTRDPWYSLRDACQKIGISYNSAALSSYLKKGWLHPVKVPLEGGNHWTWLFFKSDIDKFLADDPRMKDSIKRIKARQTRRLQEGKPAEFCMVWRMICPVCKKVVLVKANSHMVSTEIQKLFVKTYIHDGKCSGHDTQCWVKRPLKPYRTRPAAAVKKVYPPRWPERKPGGEVILVANQS
jgi:hypothetical protein